MTDERAADAERGPGSALPPPHSRAEDAAALVIGAFLLSWGILLLHSVHGLSGGTAGVAFLASYLLPVQVGVAYFILNLPFYWLAVRRVGWEFTIKTFVAVTLTSIGSAVLPGLVHLRMPLFLATAFSGLSLGLAFLVLFRHRASAGGFGVLVFYLQERFGWRAGYIQLALDLAVLAASVVVVSPLVLLASALGVAVLDVTLALNHRPGRYLGR